MEDFNNNCTIHNNTVFDNKEDGIRLINSSYNTIRNNTAYNGRSNGILLLKNSNNNSIFYNSLYENEDDGVAIGGTPGSHNNIVYRNFVYNNKGTGISLGGDNNSISHNAVYDNNNGIGGWQSHNSIVSANNVFGNNGSIDFDESDNVSIISNTIFNNSFSGSSIRNSEYATVTLNTVYNNKEFGIVINTPKYANISFNTVYNNGWAGIALESSEKSIIRQNNVSNCGNGITISESYNNTVTENAVYENSPRGIIVTFSNYTLVTYNIIFENAEWGISFEPGADDNIVQFNDFSRNSGGNPPQALDQGINNTFSSNYWSDWSVVGSYAIAGEAMNQDLTPLTNPFHLSAPIVTAPTSEVSILKDNVTIQWTSSRDIFGHSFTYAIHYSTDNGVTWKELITELTTINYTLDTMTISDGHVLLKVASIDSEGFISKTITGAFIIDNHLPVVTIDSPLNQKYTTGTIAVTLMGDAANYWYYIESVDGQNQTWTTSVTRTLTDGTYTLHAYGNDSVGNIAHVSVIFTIEIPTITTTTTTTTTALTSPTTLVPTVGTPSWNVLVPLLSLIAILALRHRKKKA